MSTRTLETPISTATAAAPARQVAVIDIGTSSVRMAVAEITAAGQVRQLETLAQAVNLGKDAFISGAISKATIEDCVRVLKSYRRILKNIRSRTRRKSALSQRVPFEKRRIGWRLSIAFTLPRAFKLSRWMRRRSFGSRSWVCSRFCSPIRRSVKAAPW